MNNRTLNAANNAVVGNEVDLPPAQKAIFTSLREAFKNCPLAVTDELLDKVNVQKNPRRTSVAPDNAEYWVKEDNTILRIRIPGRLDLKSDASKIGPYFDAWSEKNQKAYLASENVFKRVKAQFAIQAFPSGDSEAACPYVPDEVADISDNTKIFLAYLAECCDEKKDKDVHSQDRPIKYPFVHEGADDTFTFHVKSGNIFKLGEDVCKSSVPELVNTPPSKLFSRKNKAIYATPSKLREHVDNESPSPLTTASTNKILLSELGDPDGAYARLTKRSPGLKDATVVCPNVRDANGKLIPPTEYAQKLQHLAPVTVDVTLKLWEIFPDGNNINGRRNYHLSLDCLQLHPCTVAGELGMLISDLIVEKGKKRMAGVVGYPYAEEPRTPTKAGKRVGGTLVGSIKREAEDA